MTSLPATTIDRPPTRIAAGRSRLSLRPAELWAYRELLYFMVWRDAKVRYRHTVLGAAWAVLQPLLTMIVFAIVFGKLAKVPSDGQPYGWFVFAGLVPWTYFSSAIGAGANSLVGSQHVISKVYFPRLLIPSAAVVTPLIDFLITLTLFLLALVAAGRTPPLAVLLLPAFTLLAIGSALATSLWLSALNVSYRDVRYLLPFFLQFWMFATPVVFPSSMVPEPWRTLSGLNPMATVVEGFRWGLLGTPAPAQMTVVSIVVVILALVSGVAYFRRMEGTFADVL